jgi:hypothetical protein
MSNTENKPFFGQIGKRPVLGWRDSYGSYSLRQRRWRSLSPSDLQKVTPLTRRSFLRRYGRKITSLPDWFANTFVPLTVIGERGLAGICHTASTRFFQRCQSADCSGDVIPFEPYYRERERQSREFFWATTNIARDQGRVGAANIKSCDWTTMEGSGKYWQLPTRVAISRVWGLAFNAAVTAWHICDWVFNDMPLEQRKKLRFKNIGKLQDHAKKQCRALYLCRYARQNTDLAG